VDGPRRKFVQRGEGQFYLKTDNQPPCDEISLRAHNWSDPRIKDWCEPFWSIYQNIDGSIEIHSCRPTTEEVIEGDLLGDLGSVIKIASPSRISMRNALRLARRLCQCDPDRGITLDDDDQLVGITSIESNIPVLAF
jgi:hypothetical protein